MRIFESVCTKGASVSYYWRETDAGRHLEATIVKAIENLESSDRVLSRVQRADCKAQIKKHLVSAERGELVPVEHVRRIERATVADMFEIRWQNLPYTPVDKVSGLYSEPALALARLYFVEEGQNWIAGMWVHRKDILETNEETESAQNDEIDKAVGYFKAQESRSWGIDELVRIRKKV